jgi:hypothetical protein
MKVVKTSLGRFFKLFWLVLTVHTSKTDLASFRTSLHTKVDFCSSTFQGVVWLLGVFCNLSKVFYIHKHKEPIRDKRKLEYIVLMQMWGKPKIVDAAMYFKEFRSPLNSMSTLRKSWETTVVKLCPDCSQSLSLLH